MCVWSTHIELADLVHGFKTATLPKGNERVRADMHRYASRMALTRRRVGRQPRSPDSRGLDRRNGEFPKYRVDFVHGHPHLSVSPPDQQSEQTTPNVLRHRFEGHRRRVT